MQLQHVVAVLESLSPLGLAESWDKVGLQVGDGLQDVTGALVCLDLVPAVLDEALTLGCGLIVSYHPVIFEPVKRLVEQGGWKQRVLRGLVGGGVAVFSPHTALDAVRGGMGDWLAECVGEGVVEPLLATELSRDEFKVVVFVPVGCEALLREAMSAAGAGWVGNYRECSFALRGEGGFRALPGARPAVGRVGERETVEEVRLEMIAPGRYLQAILSAVRAAHPYEEPAIDVFKLEPEPVPMSSATGAGRRVTLAQPIESGELASRVKRQLGVASVRLAGASQVVRSVALCPGSGGTLFEGVEADAYVTGEMQHHQVLDLVQRGKVVVLAGHTHTERPYLPAYRERLASACPSVAWHVSAADVNPWQAV